MGSYLAVASVWQVRDADRVKVQGGMTDVALGQQIGRFSQRGRLPGPYRARDHWEVIHRSVNSGVTPAAGIAFNTCDR